MSNWNFRENILNFERLFLLGLCIVKCYKILAKNSFCFAIKKDNLEFYTKLAMYVQSWTIFIKSWILISCTKIIIAQNIHENGNGTAWNGGDGNSHSARRYEVTEGQKNSIAKFQSLSMSATTGKNNHVATQNNVMMNPVAVQTHKESTIEINP